MKIFKGKKRIVVTLPSLGIVIKFPIIHFAETLVTIFIGLTSKTNWTFLKVFLKGNETEGFSTTLKGRLLGGILENWREYSFFRRTKNIFLQPTYFSLFGFINIQKFGVVTNLEERKFRWMIDPIIGDDFYKDPHHLSNPENFCIENGKLKIFDYGSLKCQEVIEKWGVKIHKEFDIKK